MSARSRWLELAKWCEQQARKSHQTEARSKREERALAYRGRMYARIATYIRQHPELPAVSHPKRYYMDRQRVDSSNIDSIGFDKGPPAIMEIAFKGGGVYQYTSDDDTVVQEHFTEIMKAESKGRHFTAHVRHDKRLNTKRVDRVDTQSSAPSA